MISIETFGVGKRYGVNRLFKNFNYKFIEGENYAITGINGSGKSTFLLVLNGFVTPNEGKVSWKNNDTLISIENYFKYFAYASPALEIFDQLSLREVLSQHASFTKSFQLKKAIEMVAETNLEKALDKPVSGFSSGMKQRVKLILTFNNDVPVLFLDEPCANLDEKGMEFYKKNIKNCAEKKLIIVATNQPAIEFPINGQQINLDEFKTK